MIRRRSRAIKLLLFGLALLSALHLVFYMLTMSPARPLALDAEQGYHDNGLGEARWFVWSSGAAPHTLGSTSLSRVQALTTVAFARLVTTAPLLVNPHNFSVILRPAVGCRPGLYAVVYIHSDPRNFKRRQLVRQTWGDPAILQSVNATLVFLMGKVHNSSVMEAVRMESSRYGDILMEDYLDAYRNLTHKAISGLKWVSENCSTTSYLLKSDDDILMDVYGVLKHLKTVMEPRHGGHGVILCHRWQNMKVIRDKRSKWYTSEEEFKGKIFDVYCSGSAYVLSTDVVRKLYEASRYTPFMWVDDYYVTGALVKKTNTTITPFNSAYMFNEKTGLARMIAGNGSELMVFHIHSSNIFFNIWKMILHRNKISLPSVVPKLLNTSSVTATQS